MGANGKNIPNGQSSPEKQVSELSLKKIRLLLLLVLIIPGKCLECRPINRKIREISTGEKISYRQPPLRHRSKCCKRCAMSAL